MKQLVILANKYPNTFDPNINVFTQQTAWTFADLGYDCIVICPSAVNLNATNRKLMPEAVETTELGNFVRIVRPRYFSLGQRPGPFNKERVSFTVSHYVRAAISAIKNYSIEPALFFGEFLCPCGVAAAKLGDLFDVPSFFQHGEALYFGNEYFGNDILRDELLKNLTGAIAVSSQNKGYLLNAGIVPVEKIGVFPNGCRADRFYSRDRREARCKMGWPEDAFIVGLTGSFDDRKGVMRLKHAVEQIDNVYYACAGKGPLDPSGKKCLLSSPINNADLPWYLSALDAFVLPTQNEGCCTAIVEAICCGLPIISADRSFNYDICDEDNSILVNPDRIDEVAAAIERLRDDDGLRKRLARGSREKASKLDLKNRVASIATWLDKLSGGALESVKISSR